MCFIEKVLFKNLQKQKNICVGVTFLIMLQAKGLQLY